MDDLPELPFEKVLSYLSFEDRIRARAVSRRWYMMISSFKVKSLCFSTVPRGYVRGKSQWTSGAYAQNFISSPRSGLFFNTFGPTILSCLKHLRLCDASLNAENRTAFTSVFQSFGQLEELDLVRFYSHDGAEMDFELNLPVVKSIQLIDSKGINTLTVDAPHLRRAKFIWCSASLRLNLVHAESVKKLIIDDMQQTAVPKLKNLEHLYCGHSSGFAPTFLSDLQLLKEIHFGDLANSGVRELFDQKQRDGRADLKIHRGGVLLDGPDDLAATIRRIDVRILTSLDFTCLVENRSRLAEEIPFFRILDYSPIEHFTPASETDDVLIDVLNRLTDLHIIIVFRPIQNVQRFLDTLKNLENVVDLSFYCDQPQELFDQLPEHCAVQGLFLFANPSDFQFLFRLKHMVQLHLTGPINAELIRKLFEDFQFLLLLTFKYASKTFSIQIRNGTSNRFVVSVGEKKKRFSDSNDAIQFITKHSNSVLRNSFGFVSKFVRSKFSFLRF